MSLINKRHGKAAVLLVTTIFLTACANTKISQSWAEPGNKRSYDDILIIGIAESEQNRRAYESHFVESLREVGTEAVASYKLIKSSESASQEAGTALGGGGDMSTAHVVNFFDAVRGKAELTAPMHDGAITMAMVHYSNIAYRIGKGFDVDEQTGRMFDRDAMKLWGRDYEPGWEPKI